MNLPWLTPERIAAAPPCPVCGAPSFVGNLTGRDDPTDEELVYLCSRYCTVTLMGNGTVPTKGETS